MVFRRAPDPISPPRCFVFEHVTIERTMFNKYVIILVVTVLGRRENPINANNWSVWFVLRWKATLCFFCGMYSKLPQLPRKKLKGWTPTKKIWAFRNLHWYFRSHFGPNKLQKKQHSHWVLEGCWLELHIFASTKVSPPPTGRKHHGIYETTTLLQSPTPPAV